MEDNTSIPSRKTMISELIKGRECTKKLQNLLSRGAANGRPESAEDLVTKIVGSFSDSLTTFCSVAATTSVRAAPAVKDRRGCYKRQKTEDSRVKIAYTYEDGFAWRKYGQKVILNAKFPRCYYRCTYKDAGCIASKQVQKLENGSEMFHITYFGSHTCKNINENPQMYSNSKDLSFCLLSFEDTRINHSPCNLSTITNIHRGKGYGAGKSPDVIDFRDYVGEMEMRWSNNRDEEDGFAGTAHLSGEGTMTTMDIVGARSGVGVQEYHSAQIGMEHTELDWDGRFVCPNTPSFNQVVVNTGSDDYLASSRHDTSSNYAYAWEDMIGNLEQSYNNIFKDDIYTDDFSFY